MFRVLVITFDSEESAVDFMLPPHGERMFWVSPSPSHNVDFGLEESTVDFMLPPHSERMFWVITLISI